MGASIERRSGEAIRVPMDALIELASEDFGDRFEADCVNVSARGLSLRAAYLPEVGSRLACAFDATGQRIEAQAEVVWAEDTGKHMGEFGVRFTDMDPTAERLIHEIVADALSRDTAVANIDTNTTAHLSLDAIQSPIVARITHRADDLVTVEQELPFLKLGTGLSVRVGTEQKGRRGRIGSVDLSLAGETPSLVLQVLYDDDVVVADKAPAAREEETTLTDFEAPKMETITATGDYEVPTRDSVPPMPEATTRERDPVRIIRTDPGLAEELAAIKGTAGSVSVALATVWATVVAVMGPVLAKFWAKVVHVSKEVARRAGPVLSEAVARTGRVSGHWVALLRERASARFPAFIGGSPSRARRVTSPVPAVVHRVAKTRVQGAAVVEEKKHYGRFILLAALLIAGGALAVIAFTAGADDDISSVRTSPVAPAPVAAAVQTPVAVAPVAVSAAPAAVAPVAAPLAPAPIAAVPAAMQTQAAMPAPSYAAGRLPVPDFPTLRDAPRPAAPPAAVPAGSPYAVDVRAGGASVSATPAAVTPAALPSAIPPMQAPTGVNGFGDPTISGGQIYTLRMDRRIAGIEGSRGRLNFTVRVLGALSLDRAAPIFARHPAVERAAIVNSGDHADLTVQFRSGMPSPNFHVRARGSSLEITLTR